MPFLNLCSLFSDKTPKVSCPVCLDDLSSIDERVTQLTCGHLVCKNCFSQFATHNFVTCPLCRKTIKDITEIPFPQEKPVVALSQRIGRLASFLQCKKERYKKKDPQISSETN